MLSLVITSRKLAPIRQEAKNRITALGFQSWKWTATVTVCVYIYIAPVHNYTFNDINISVHACTNTCVFQPWFVSYCLTSVCVVFGSCHCLRIIFKKGYSVPFLTSVFRWWCSSCRLTIQSLVPYDRVSVALWYSLCRFMIWCPSPYDIVSVALWSGVRRLMI
jgi:hypothetical protein